MEKHKSLLNQYRGEILSWVNEYSEDFMSFKNDYQNIVSETSEEFENMFSDFINEYRPLYCEWQERRSEHAVNFSVFKILKIKRIEEGLHSPILAELLDPNGIHEQTDLFYKLFINQFLPKERAEHFIHKNPDNYLVEKEKYIRNSKLKGRIDISIMSKTPDKKFALIIENKWGSGDSCDNQLYNYYSHYINSFNYTNDNLLVFYLTKHGGNPNPKRITKSEFKKFLHERKNKNFFAISYHEHISKWLMECHRESKSEKVKHIIEQYLTSII